MLSEICVKPHRKFLVLSLAAALFWGVCPEVSQAEGGDPAREPTVLAVEKVMPAVVNINTERVVRQRYRDPYDEIIAQFFGRSGARPREFHHKVQSLGSGFIIDAEGHIVTNEHVVTQAEDLKISVTTSDGKTYEARYITGDADADLALLKIEGEGPFPNLPLGEPSPNHLGQTVLVVGNPMGYGHSVARGILSAANRTLAMEKTELRNLLQTDAAINPGNSGGPLIDLSGRLVGVASAKMAYGAQGMPIQGIGFAIPAGDVAQKVEEFKREGRGESAAAGAALRKLGLSLQEMTPDLSEAFGVEPGTAILISDVASGSPAEQAGIRRGMVVFHVNGRPAHQLAGAERQIAKVKAGEQVQLTIGIPQRRRGVVLQRMEMVALRAR